MTYYMVIHGEHKIAENHKRAKNKGKVNKCNILNFETTQTVSLHDMREKEKNYSSIPIMASDIREGKRC